MVSEKWGDSILSVGTYKSTAKREGPNPPHRLIPQGSLLWLPVQSSGCVIVWTHNTANIVALLAHRSPKHVIYDLWRLILFLLPHLCFHGQRLWASLMPLLVLSLEEGDAQAF